MNGHPLALHLPGGVVAQLVPGSRPPRYTVNGQPCDVDVTIPEDLAAAGWCWFGTWLWRPCDEEPPDTFGVIGVFGDGPGVCIGTRTFPPPLCFEQARIHERLRGTLVVTGAGIGEVRQLEMAL